MLLEACRGRQATLRGLQTTGHNTRGFNIRISSASTRCEWKRWGWYERKRDDVRIVVHSQRQRSVTKQADRRDKHMTLGMRRVRGVRIRSNRILHREIVRAAQPTITGKSSTRRVFDRCTCLSAEVVYRCHRTLRQHKHPRAPYTFLCPHLAVVAAVEYWASGANPALTARPHRPARRARRPRARCSATYSARVHSRARTRAEAYG